ncbi:MAG: hypothetical protein WD051_01755 [Steroidobacteraceae bacterium]
MNSNISRSSFSAAATNGLDKANKNVIARQYGTDSFLVRFTIGLIRFLFSLIIFLKTVGIPIDTLDSTHTKTERISVYNPNNSGPNFLAKTM